MLELLELLEGAHQRVTGAQLFLFDRRHWRGDRLHTAVHVAFTLLWAYLTAVSAWALAAAL